MKRILLYIILLCSWLGCPSAITAKTYVKQVWNVTEKPITATFFFEQSKQFQNKKQQESLTIQPYQEQLFTHQRPLEKITFAEKGSTDSSMQTIIEKENVKDFDDVQFFAVHINPNNNNLFAKYNKNAYPFSPIHIYNVSSLSGHVHFYFEKETSVSLQPKKGILIPFDSTQKNPITLDFVIDNTKSNVHIPLNAFNGDGTDYLNIQIPKTENQSTTNLQKNLDQFITLNSVKLSNIFTQKTVKNIKFHNKSVHSGWITLQDGQTITFNGNQNLSFQIPYQEHMTVAMRATVKANWLMNGQPVDVPTAYIPKDLISDGTTIELIYDKKSQHEDLAKKRELYYFIKVNNDWIKNKVDETKLTQKFSNNNNQNSKKEKTTKPNFDYTSLQKSPTPPGVRTIYNQTNETIVCSMQPNLESGATLIQPNAEPDPDGAYRFSIKPNTAISICAGNMHLQKLTIEVNKYIEYEKRIFNNQTNRTITVQITTDKPSEFLIPPNSSTAIPITADNIHSIQITGKKDDKTAYLENNPSLDLNRITACNIQLNQQTGNSFLVSTNQGAIDAFTPYSKEGDQLICKNKMCSQARIVKTVTFEENTHPEINNHTFLAITQASLQQIEAQWYEETPTKFFNPHNFTITKKQFHELSKLLEPITVSVPKLETITLSMETYAPADSIQKKALAAQSNKQYQSAGDLFKKAADTYQDGLQKLQKQSPMNLKAIGDYASFAAQLYFSSATSYMQEQKNNLTATALAFDAQSKALSALCSAYLSYSVLLYNENLLITKQSSSAQKQLMQRLEEKVNFTLMQTITHAQHTLQSLLQLIQKLPLPKNTHNSDYTITVHNETPRVTLPYNNDSFITWTNKQIKNPWFGLSQYTQEKIQATGSYFVKNFPNLVFAQKNNLYGSLQTTIGNELQANLGQALSSSLPPIFWGPKETEKNLFSIKPYQIGLPKHAWSGYDLNLQLCILQTTTALLTQMHSAKSQGVSKNMSQLHLKQEQNMLTLFEQCITQANITIQYLLMNVPTLKKQDNTIASFDEKAFTRIFAEQYFKTLLPILTQEIHILSNYATKTQKPTTTKNNITINATKTK